MENRMEQTVETEIDMELIQLTCGKRGRGEGMEKIKEAMISQLPKPYRD